MLYVNLEHRKKDVATASQVIYSPGNTVVARGNKITPRPDAYASLAPGEQIVQVFGTADSLVTSIGFRTSYGRTLGPWGGTGSSSYQVNGVAAGLFGRITPEGTFGSIGVYTTLTGRSKYPTYWGSLNGRGWDGGPSYPGTALLPYGLCRDSPVAFLFTIPPSHVGPSHAFHPLPLRPHPPPHGALW